MKVKLIIFLFLTSKIIFAEDLGVFGKIYPINEPDMLDWIQGKAKNLVETGEWKKIQNETIAKVKNQINNPLPLEKVSDGFFTQVHYLKPIVTVKDDITDTRGHIIAKAGTYNVLKYKPFDVRLIFINGNNARQLKWVTNHFFNDGIRTKVILTSGSYLELDKKYKLWFYYDQNGSYTKKLGIKYVPAIVEQDNDQLKITELSNNEI